MYRMVRGRRRSPRPTRVLRAAMIVALWLAALSAGALAAPSGLNVIPTADVYDPGVPSVEFQSEGEGRLFGPEYGSHALVQCGVAHGLELGMDQCVSDGGPALFNGKYRLLDGEGSRPAVAIGMQNLGHGQVAQNYVVTGWGFGRPLRAHLGAISLDGAVKPMAGADYTWKSVTLMADWVAGPENTSSIGISWAPQANMTATYSLLLPNAGEGLAGHVVNVQYLMKLW